METFALKPVIHYGTNALSALERLSPRRVLIVTDDFLSHKSGLLERITARLKGCEYKVFDQVTPDPSLRLVAQGVQELRDFRPDVVLAFGGGSPMDCAKAMRQCADGERLSLWCVPTTAGTGSEVTSFAVLTDTDKGVKYPLVDAELLPDEAVLDPSLLAGVPAGVTADTGMDVLTHAAEAYVAQGATPFTDALAEKAFVLAYKNLPEARGAEGESPAKENMLLASCMAGIAFNAAGLGISHSMAHAMGGRWHTPHGRLNAMLLPVVIRFNAEDPIAAEKYGILARLCGLSGSARALAAALSRLRESLKMPESLTACGLPRAAVLSELDAVAAAAQADVCTPGNPRAASASELATLIKELV